MYRLVRACGGLARGRRWFDSKTAHSHQIPSSQPNCEPLPTMLIIYCIFQHICWMFLLSPSYICLYRFEWVWGTVLQQMESSRYRTESQVSLLFCGTWVGRLSVFGVHEQGKLYQNSNYIVKQQFKKYCNESEQWQCTLFLASHVWLEIYCW